MPASCPALNHNIQLAGGSSISAYMPHAPESVLHERTPLFRKPDCKETWLSICKLGCCWGSWNLETWKSTSSQDSHMCAWCVSVPDVLAYKQQGLISIQGSSVQSAKVQHGTMRSYYECIIIQLPGSALLPRPGKLTSYQVLDSLLQGQTLCDTHTAVRTHTLDYTAALYTFLIMAIPRSTMYLCFPSETTFGLTRRDHAPAAFSHTCTS